MQLMLGYIIYSIEYPW